MTSVWQSVSQSALVCATLIMAWASIALSRQVGAAKSASDALSRRLDELSLRIRTVEARKLKSRGDDPTTPKPKPAPSVACPVSIHRPDPAETASISTPRLIAVPSLATVGSEAAATRAAGELSRRFGTIWTLADAGEPADAIALATGHPIGQVELILGLRRTSDNATITDGSGTNTHA